MQRICSNGPLVQGLDCYHGDIVQDWNQVANAGVKYVFLKASEFSVDPKFKMRWNALRDLGFIRGAYHFFHPSNDPAGQADLFLQTVGPLLSGDLPLVMDWESTDGQPSYKDRANAMTFLSRIENAIKTYPIIYTSPYFAEQLNLDIRFEKFPLWIAHYGVNCPSVPKPWKNWTFWQTSEQAKIPGVLGPCDEDVFNGSVDQLKALTIQ